jgi:methionyl-tRNA formyltransferase
MALRIIYMGTPDFAVPALEQVALGGHGDLALVVTQPDRAAGRGRKHVAPAVKTAAERLGVPVLQTPTLGDPVVRQRITDIQPDLIVVAAFGMILGKWILELPTKGCVNLHASLLPKYRGANPIAAAIAQGEDVTGVTLMQMDLGLDTGEIYASTEVDIELDDTTESLTQKLAHQAGALLEDKIRALLDGSLSPVPQGEGATLTRQMTKADGWLDFSRHAVELERHVRATWPWPRAWTTDSAGERIQVHAASVSEGAALDPGQIAHADGQVFVGTADGALILRRVQLPGGRPIEGASIQQVGSLSDGQTIGTVDQPVNLPPLVISVPNG